MLWYGGHREIPARALGRAGGHTLVGQWGGTAEAGDSGLTKRGKMIPIPEGPGLATAERCTAAPLPPLEMAPPTPSWTRATTSEKVRSVCPGPLGQPGPTFPFQRLVPTQ